MELSSIKIKMILLVTAILVCGFLTTNILSFQVSKNALRTTLLNNELPLTSDNIYSEIQSDFIRPVLVSSLMANDTFLRDWVTGGENDVGKISRYLDAIRKRYNAFTAFFISNNTLNYYHFSGPSRTLNATDPHDAWFFRVRDMVDTYEINVDENKEQENALTIFINYKTFDGDGNFIGVSGVGLGLDSVKEVVKKYEQIFARNIFFVDKEGVIRVSSRGEIVNKNIKNLKGMQDLVDDSLSQERGSFSYSRDGEEYLLTTRYIPELKWYLFVELPESEATSGIRR
ncbi:MAG: cache domain-containing protein, partial [Rhodospirillaceae bacterium]|nr:cache domain-containing protein [Rhodospirillaceae bacterium]